MVKRSILDQIWWEIQYWQKFEYFTSFHIKEIIITFCVFLWYQDKREKKKLIEKDCLKLYVLCLGNINSGLNKVTIPSGIKNVEIAL